MKKFLFSILIAFISFSCTSEKDIQKAVYPNLFDGKYDSEFPYRSSSQELELISNSINLVNNLTFYKTFYFDKESKVTLNEIRNGDYLDLASSTSMYQKTASGTGTIVYNLNKTVLVLTCSHIVSFPDSIVNFYRDDFDHNTPYVDNISIIQRSSLYYVPFPENTSMKLIVDDKDRDVALLKIELRENHPGQISVFKSKIGKAKELDWGSFVYIFGYPLNYKMISKGIVSSPNKGENPSFLIDAVFNQGYSGGLVLAIRDGVPNFELVGMIKSVPADHEIYLRPKDWKDIRLYPPGKQYNGPIYTDLKTTIKYGVTKVLSIESILQFLENSKDLLQSHNISLTDFFK